MSQTNGLEAIKKQFQENKRLKTATVAVVALVVIVIGYIAYKQLVFAPKEEKSLNAIYPGLNLAAKDSTDAAIAALEPVVKKYDGTKGGEIAQFTLARQYMTKGNFKKALDLLDGVSISDTYTSVRVIGLQGDCYSEMGKFKDALGMYEDAAAKNENEFTTPEYLFKAGLVAEMELKDFAKATELYEKIRDNYATYAQQKAIDKYIARASNKK
jgi:predicted negative regulator of RcsB-dependent stress response